MIVEALRRQGSTPSKYESCELADVTVLVGPNNAGKTQTLQDIRDLVIGSDEPLIFDTHTFSDLNSLSDYLDQLFVHNEGEDVVIPGQKDRYVSVDRSMWRRWHTEDIHVQTNDVLETLGPAIVQFLDAASRLQLATDITIPEDNSPRSPQNMALSLLYRPEHLFQEFRDIFMEVFDVQPILDYSEQGEIRICVGDGDRTPPEHPRELGNFIETNNFVPLSETGDGFLSFAGVVGSLLVSQGRLVLLDEPSAFLHPAQARRLGEWIADAGTTYAEQVVLTTHNANFLNGILDATTDVAIYRLNRGSETTTFHKVGRDVAKQITEEPILRSQRVLEAAFRQGAVICEGGSDRATYRTVARLVQEETNIQFIDSIGKSKVAPIAEVLARANIPVSAIVDLDVFKNVQEFNQILRAAGGGLENNEIQHVLHEFNEVKDEIDNSHFDQGIGSLSADHQEIVADAIDEAAEYHVYVVPSGAVESWIDLDRSKSVWVEKALEVIADGDCPEDLEKFVGRTIADVQTQYRSTT